MKIKSFLSQLLFFVLIFCSYPIKATENVASLPMGRGLPVEVFAGLTFNNINSINENEASFEASVDTRLTWIDRRLRFDRSSAIAGFLEFKDESADQRLGQIWQPKIEFLNIKGAPSLESKNLRIYPDGSVDLIRRETGKFSMSFSMTKFPFDMQSLAITLISRYEPNTKVLLDFSESQVNFSNSIYPSESTGWDFGVVNLKKAAVAGLRDTQYSTLTASLQIKRQPFSAISTIVLPLVCCLLIPLLVLWINTLKHDDPHGFGEPNTMLASFAMTGIFAVVALNFTVDTNYIQLIQGDNPIIRLFALNYFMLALSIFISVALYRYYLVKRLFGRYVQAELFHVLCWAIPTLCLGVTVAILALAYLG
jgi:hypothetical protein